MKHDGQVGFSLRVGGGLSNEPHLAVRLDAFVLPEQAVRVVQAITEIFRDQQVLRESRDRARLKYLFMKEGWTAERFLDELQSRLDFTLRPGVPRSCARRRASRSCGHSSASGSPDSRYVGASVLRGRLTGEQLEAAAELADKFGSGALRATVSQNLLFIDVPNEKAGELVARAWANRPARGRLAVLARSCGLHGNRVLQAGHHRDQGLHALAGGRDWKSAFRNLISNCACT